MLPIPTIQWWLVWSAVHECWLIRYEAPSALPLDIATVMLQQFFIVLLSRKLLSHSNATARSSHHDL